MNGFSQDTFGDTLLTQLLFSYGMADLLGRWHSVGRLWFFSQSSKVRIRGYISHFERF